MFQKTFAKYQILEIPETRNGVEIPGIGRRVIGDVVTLNTNEVESRAPNGEESFLNTMFDCGMLMKLPGTVASMVAIRDAFCGRRTYLPGEAFETDHSTAARLEAVGHAVPADQYTDCRLVLVKALATFSYQGKVRNAGSEFEAANLFALQRAATGEVQVLGDAPPWVLIRNANADLERWWPSEVWATVLAGNDLTNAVEDLLETVRKMQARLKERGLPRECQLFPETIRQDWLPYELNPLRDDLPSELNMVWTGCHHFELMVERLPQHFECGQTWKRDCKAAAITIVNSITDHSGTDPSKSIPAFVRRLHQGESLEGLDSVKELHRLLVPLRGYSVRLSPHPDNESGRTVSLNSDSDTTKPRVVAFGELPHWNPETRVLTFCGITRKFAPQTGQKVLTILSAFQEFGWRTREDNPLDSEDAKQALRTLNADQSLPIRFEKDGDQIAWVKKSP